MANAVKGEVVVKLKDGRSLTMLFDIEALIEAESAAGLRMKALQAELMSGDPSLKLVRALIYGGLRAHHSDISLKGAGELLRTDGEAVVAAMTAGVGGAFDDGEAAAAKDDDEDPTKRARSSPKSGTGDSSSADGAA